MPATNILPRAPLLFRAYSPKGKAKVGVDRENRVINGYAVITRGEAVGHGVWIDDVMLDQVAAAGNAAPKGIKSRFTHPGLCSDGLGKYLGRSRQFRRDGDITRADLHFSTVTDKSPAFESDPAEYLMAMAEEDPFAFATSIVFCRDQAAMEAFMVEHGGVKVEDEYGGHWEGFKSPDPMNVSNLPHARLAALRASDIVDEPAANPGGFFSRGEETAVNAEKFLSWIFGKSAVAPGPEAMGGGDPNRIREFVYGFLARHGLEVIPKRPAQGQEATVADSQKAQTPAPVTPAPTPVDPMQAAREQFAANVKALREAFPKDEAFAVQCAADGLSVEQAKAKYSDVIAARLASAEGVISEREKTIAELKAENAGIKAQLLSGAQPVMHGTTPEPKNAVAEVEAAREYAREHKCSLADAFRALAKPQQ